MKNGATVFIGVAFAVVIVTAIYYGAKRKSKQYSIDWNLPDELIVKDTGLDLDQVIKMRAESQVV